MKLSRRQFTGLLALGGSASIFPRQAWSQSDLERLLNLPPLPPLSPLPPDEKYWTEIRNQFVLPSNLAFFNAANLCPAPMPVIETAARATRAVDADPSPAVKTRLQQERETARQRIARYLRVTPEEIVMTRNTSEANNLVSSGVRLGQGDEVVIFSDNHPSNHAAWREKAKRFGFTVKVVEQVNPHPGAEYYVDAFARAMTPRTKVIGFSHVTNTVGDLMPARELCALARERGALSLVDGAQTFGVLDVDLSAIQPDFYTGSAHKWPCGPKEAGLLYINARSQDRISPSIVSLYGGAVGISRTHEAMGQRDEAAMIGFGEAMDFEAKIGSAVVEQRGRELCHALLEGLRRIDGVKVWTSPVAERTGIIVTFVPGTLDARRLATVLYEKHQISLTARGGEDRPGLRFSPHMYNLLSEVDRTLDALKHYSITGL